MSQSEETLTTQDVFLTEKKDNDPVHLELKSLNDAANDILDRGYKAWRERNALLLATNHYNSLIDRFEKLIQQTASAA